MKTQTYRILAQDHTISNDTWETGINNNDLIIGPSGAGKTRSYVKPNIMQCNESLVVTDTKSSLLDELGPFLKQKGVQVINIDFTSMLDSFGYNPLDYIHYDEATGKYSERDMMSIAACLVPIETTKDPFWESSARMFVEAMIGYVLECLPKEEHTLEYVTKLFGQMGVPKNEELSPFDVLMTELGEENPDSFAYKKYAMFKDLRTSDKTYECIRAFLAEKLDPLTYDGPLQMYSRPDKIDFKRLGREKTVVFLNVSDTDRSADRLVNLFYTQALHTLCESADKDYPAHRLPMPVRFILDDFAANAVIPDFDKIISVIRSREIYVSIVLQSLPQLTALYGPYRSSTIIDNCDNWLYLGGRDIETVRHISYMSNRPMDAILNLPLGQAFLFTRGQPSRVVTKFDIKSHEQYRHLPEAGLDEQAEISRPAPLHMIDP